MSKKKNMKSESVNGSDVDYKNKTTQKSINTKKIHIPLPKKRTTRNIRVVSTKNTSINSL